jgi:hypothetical protein
MRYLPVFRFLRHVSLHCVCIKCKISLCTLLDKIPLEGFTMRRADIQQPADTTCDGSRIAAIREELNREIAERLPPWPVCPDCRDHFHPEDVDPIFGGRCSFCGSARLEYLFRRVVNARGPRARRTAWRALRRFASVGR